MAAKKGSLVLIKLGNGGAPESFTTIGGLRSSNIVLNNHMVDTSNVQAGMWRQLLDHAGIKSLHISGSGIFTDSATEDAVWNYALSSSVKNYQFAFANGDYVTGPFLISAYDRSGNYDGEEVYAITLESAGNISFTAV